MGRSDSLLYAPGEVFLSLDPLSRWPPQLVPREAAGLPSFCTTLCSRATLCDPGRSLETSPVSVSSVLGSGDTTPSPPALFCIVSRLDCFSGGATPACGLRVSLCTLPNRRSAFLAY